MPKKLLIVNIGSNYKYVNNYTTGFKPLSVCIQWQASYPVRSCRHRNLEALAMHAHTSSVESINDYRTSNLPEE